jgi:hypothetical protein
MFPMKGGLSVLVCEESLDLKVLAGLHTCLWLGRKGTVQLILESSMTSLLGALLVGPASLHD